MLIVWIGIAAILINSRNINGYNIVQTLSGTVEGVTVDIDTKRVWQFRNIPYAKPPVGDLRFRKPIPYGTWQGMLDATEFGPACIQNPLPYGYLPNRNMSEDCLQLNIYTPINSTQGQPRSVMIWIHGGAYVFGEATMYDGSYLAASGDVIVVTLNYRLGLLGFFSTGDSNSPGNYGLWDQLLAIKWVKNNIAAFGGDTASITLFGESAGSYSTSFHVLNPNNRGLFRRAILESGPIAYVTPNATETALGFGVLSSCISKTENNPDVHAICECLRRKSTTEIIQLQNDKGIRNFVSNPFPIGPVLDWELVTFDPKDFEKPEHASVLSFLRSLDVLAGTTSGEGSLVMEFLIKNFEEQFNFNASKGIPVTILCDVFAPGISMSLYNNNPLITKAICDEYRSNSSDLTLQGDRILDMYGDYTMVFPAVTLLNAHSRENTVSKTYQYLFSRPVPGKYPEYPWVNLSPHAAELPFLFQPTGIGKQISLNSVQEQDLCNAMVKYWTNFAKTGNPNKAGLTHWPEYEPSQRAYIDLDIGNLTINQRVFERRINFWEFTLPSIASATSALIGK